jgi:membrane-bound serine protease (ClpP class)
MVRGRRMRLAGVTALLLLLAVSLRATDGGPSDILLIRVDGTVTAGTTQFLTEAIAEAVERQLDAVIILLDTPGGLVDATLEIIKDILNAHIPIVTYVYPRGAIAASAGTFILIAGHVAAMAPGTTVGAAMPVTIRPTAEQAQAADDKTILFLAGHMTNIAQERGRPTEIAEKFVTENLTLGAEQAGSSGIIDIIALDIPDLLEQLDGRTVSIGRDEIVLRTAGANVIDKEMTTAQKIIHFISDPQIALILFLLGVYGIFFGLNTPGTIVPETVGVIALILALFGLGMFEVRALGIVLIITAIILFVIEAFTPTFGFFTAAGTAALVVGALLLPVEPLLPAEWFRHFRITVYGMAAVTAGFFVLVITKVIVVRGTPSFHQTFGMHGYQGLVMEELDPVGLVKIRGEWWKARTDLDVAVLPATRIRVVGQEGMVLVVKPVGSGETAGKSGEPGDDDSGGTDLGLDELDSSV